MRCLDIEFYPVPESDVKEYFSLLNSFFSYLAANGLVLDAGQRLSMNEGCPVLHVIAVDDDAISQENFNYDTRETLKAIVSKSTRVPQILNGAEYLDMGHCTCAKPSCLILQAPPEWLGTPIVCADCGKSYPIYKLIKQPLDRDFSELLRWRKLYRAYRCEYFSGFDMPHSLEMIKNCVSPLALIGRKLCGELEQSSGIMMLYPLFARYERLPRTCPQCGNGWVNPYTDAIAYERFCRACRLVMRDEGAGDFERN